MIFKFYQLYRSLKEVIGIEGANKIFPEYEFLPDKMIPEEQTELARILMNRIDEEYDKDIVLSIRMKHPCGIPRPDKQKMLEIKTKFFDLNERLQIYSDYLNGSSIKLSDNAYIFSWGNKKCVCGMFRKLENYEVISPTWCQCCNGNNKLQLEYLLEKEINSELIEGICSGGKVCSFKIII